MKTPLIIALTTMLLPALVTASEGQHDLAALFTGAIGATNDDYRREWAYTERRTRKGITHVGTYTPGDEAPWKLVSVDDREPTEAEIAEYLEQKVRQREGGDRGRGRQRGQTNVRDMVDVASLTLLEDDGEHWVVGFVPTGEGDDRDFMRKLDGKMGIRKADGLLAWMDIRSSAPFKPQFTMKVHEFATSFTFAVMAGQLLPDTAKFRMRASVIGVIDIDESVSTTYSDYRHVGSE